MVNVNQVSIEVKNTFKNWDFTRSVELATFSKFSQGPTMTDLFDVFFIDSLVGVIGFNCYRSIHLASFFLQLFGIVVLDIAHTLINSILIVITFISRCRNLVVVGILFENQFSRNHCIDNRVSQGCY